MNTVILTASPRDLTGKKVKKLRREGLLPISVYGKDIKSLSLTVPLKDFMKVYAQVGETGLVELKTDGHSQHTLIADVQIHPVGRVLLHVQFHAVKLTEKIRANVPLELTGESPAVASGTGVILQTLNEVEVEALPTNLPEKIIVDVSGMTEVGQQITVGDLSVAKEIALLTDRGEIVIKLAPAVSEEAKKEAEAAAKAATETATAETPTPPEPPTTPDQEPPA